MQKNISIKGLTLFYDASNENSVELIQKACEKSIRIIQEHLGLELPKDCRVYIMTSWFQLFQSVPWFWKILLTVTIPFWALRVKKIWPFVGGWEQKFGQRRIVGVKPPRLLQLADRKIGDRIFIKEKNIEEKVQNITCHELTHAFTSHLRLPIWLKEGLAMIMVDKFFKKTTVQKNTLEILQKSSGSYSGYDGYRFKDKDALVYLYARGYWLTRYIEETQPELLKDLLTKRYRKSELEENIAKVYGKKKNEFWNEIDLILVSYFK